MRLAYDLARHLGYRSGHALLADLDPAEWAYWVAAYKTSPWGGDWERTSLLLSSLINFLSRMAPGDGDVEDLPFDAFVPYRTVNDGKIACIDEAVSGLEALRF